MNDEDVYLYYHSLRVQPWHVRVQVYGMPLYLRVIHLSNASSVASVNVHTIEKHEKTMMKFGETIPKNIWTDN